MTPPAELHHDLETLHRLLDQVLQEQAGPELAQTLHQIRQLARERRLGLPGAGDELAERIGRLNETEIAAVVRAFSVFFDLANLAEDLQRVRVLRERAASREREPPESVGDAIAQFHRAGLSAEAVQQLLDRLSIDLVFTAHPTEAKRRTTRRVLRQLRAALRESHRPDVLPSEQQELTERMLGDLTLLWQVDPIRPQRPTVMHEVERGLFFFDGLWQILPLLRRQLREALALHYPGCKFRIPAWVRFSSWIGGDRDGNPFVTTDITAQALELLRRTAVERHLTACRQLSQLLVMSERQFAVDESLKQALASAISKRASLRQAAESVSEVEVYRRWLRVIEARLEATLAAASGPLSDSPAYHAAEELQADVQRLADSIGGHRGERIVAGQLQTWLDQIASFGLQAAALDIRQDSRVHVDVLAEIFKRLGLCADYRAADEPTRRALLLRGPTVGNELLQYGLSEITRETLGLFKLLVRTVRAHGAERLGGHVISMTHQPSDVLAVWWLWHWAWKATPGGDPSRPAYLPIIPLLETIDDLHHGPEILSALLEIPQYREYLQTAQTVVEGLQPLDFTPTQIVMVGYSDSTKDGGYLAACWGLFRVQDRLAEVAQQHGVRLMVFHGRGGALGRGGGPAARAILSLPPHSVGGALRMTEQGEVLAERYDDPQIAQRHLEQVTWATMLVSGLPAEPVPKEWIELMDRLSERSFHRYRELVDHPGFLAYFEQATPIAEIERLPIGSRPARRRERKSLADLRAIPWTFAWTQCRHILPAWFGLGTAIVEASRSLPSDRDAGWSTLQTLYERWPLFQAIIDNAVLALAKADMDIAHRYAELSGEPGASATGVWHLIQDEYQLSQAAVLMITREPALLAGTPWLQRSIQERNPSVDPLNLIQIELLRRMRAALEAGDESTAARLSELVRLTIQGVAAGLRTTG